MIWSRTAASQSKYLHLGVVIFGWKLCELMPSKKKKMLKANCSSQLFRISRCFLIPCLIVIKPQRIKSYSGCTIPQPAVNVQS